MENFYLSALVEEARTELSGATVRGVAMINSKLFFDLRLESDKRLVASLDRTSPAFYLSSVRPKKSEAERFASHPFLLALRKNVVGAKIMSVAKPALDRVIRIEIENYDAGGDIAKGSLVLALTGRSANAFLFDGEGRSYAQLFDGNAASLAQFQEEADGLSIALEKIEETITQQEALEKFFGVETPFAPIFKTELIARCKTLSPAAAMKSLKEDLFIKKNQPAVYSRLPLDVLSERVVDLKKDLLLSHIELWQAEGMHRQQYTTLSEAAEAYYSARDEAKKLRDDFSSLGQNLKLRIKKLDSAMRSIESDADRFENPDMFKRYGDLLLANLANAKVEGAKVVVTDYYDPAQKEIEIDIGDAKSLQKAASDFFSQYQKARRAQSAIAQRREEISGRLNPLKLLLGELDASPTRETINAVQQRLAGLGGKSKRAGKQAESKKRGDAPARVGRWFRSTEGFEIVVGRNDRENDQITFRLARSTDVWLHAGDYPGSHVVIRNPSRADVPHRTLIEAAEIAAFYSQAKREGKAAVHYTQKKFVVKPPRAKPGLVRLSSYKTLMVEPRCRLEQIE